MDHTTFASMTQELLFIKTAELLPADEPYRSQFKKEMWKQFAKNVGAGAVGYGLGMGAGELAGMALKPLFKGPVSPQKLGLLSKGVGLLGGLSSMSAMSAYSEAQRRIAVARERDLQLQQKAENPAREEDVHERE
jgi:hypothetical protein